MADILSLPSNKFVLQSRNVCVPVGMAETCIVIQFRKAQKQPPLSIVQVARQGVPTLASIDSAKLFEPITESTYRARLVTVHKNAPLVNQKHQKADEPHPADHSRSIRKIEQPV